MSIEAHIHRVNGITPESAFPSPRQLRWGSYLEPNVNYSQIDIRIAPNKEQKMTYAEAVSASVFEDWFRSLGHPVTATLFRDGRKRAPIHNIDFGRSSERHPAIATYHSFKIPATVSLEGIAKVPDFDDKYRVGIHVGAMLLSAPNTEAQRAHKYGLNLAQLHELS